MTTIPALAFPSVKPGLSAIKIAFALMLLTVLFLPMLAEAQSLREKLAQALEVPSNNQIQILEITPTALPTIFQIELSTGEMLYTDISGDYLFAGDMYQTTPRGLMNITASKRQEQALEDLAKVPSSEMIVFSPAGETRASIHVFTDVDCQYCQKLHGDMDKLNAQGIEVRYLAYPRGGERAASLDKMISVWCADDRKKALTQAKNKQNLPTLECDSPVLEHYRIGNRFGISGTPALVLPDGQVVPGYLDVDRLTAVLGLE